MYSKALRYTVFGSRKKPSSAKREVYTYVLEWIFFSKTVYLQCFWPKSAYLKVNVM
jgi:hypothetical protein